MRWWSAASASRQRVVLTVAGAATTVLIGIVIFGSRGMLLIW
jgi:hypothetical protein